MRLPPLRERADSMAAVLDNCLTSVCADMGIKPPALDEAGRAQLLRYDWPRNYPQLYRVLTQLAADSRDGVISAEQTAAVLREEKEILICFLG